MSSFLLEVEDTMDALLKVGDWAHHPSQQFAIRSEENDLVLDTPRKFVL